MSGQKPKEQLRNEIQTYIYSLTTNPDFMGFLEKNKKEIQDYVRTHNLQEKREHENLYEKDQMRMNYDRYAHIFRLGQKLNNTDEVFRKAEYITTVMGITLNTSAFLNTIELLGTPEQAKHWRDLVMTAQAIGGYGQTELGHGSNVQGLETTAHYDEKSKTFRINSPTVTSSKFWPGVLGNAGTHSVVQAKTFVKGKPIGVQTFVVPIRDQNLDTLPNIQAGDIGPKLGFQRVDNGYLKMNQVDIPRDFMLMKYIQVTPDGEVLGLEKKQTIKYAYGSMLYLRVYLVYGFALSYQVLPGRQLALMYQQMGVINQAQKKREVIEYISMGVGMVLANAWTQSIYNDYISNLNQSNFDKADKLLVTCHILSATFKALGSWKGLQVSTEIMTKNKYLTFRTSLMPQNFVNSFPSVTYEGDNSVLLQQTGRFILMKDSGQEILKPNLSVKSDNLEGVLKILKYVTSMEIRRIKKSFEKQFQNNVGMKTFWNEKYQRDVIEVSKLWGVMKFVQGIIITLKKVNENKAFFEKAGKVFVSKILEDATKIYLYGFQIEEANVWESFTEDEFWAMTNIQKPVDLGVEPHALLGRDFKTTHAKL